MGTTMPATKVEAPEIQDPEIQAPELLDIARQGMEQQDPGRPDSQRRASALPVRARTAALVGRIERALGTAERIVAELEHGGPEAARVGSG